MLFKGNILIPCPHCRFPIEGSSKILGALDTLSTLFRFPISDAEKEVDNLIRKDLVANKEGDNLMVVKNHPGSHLSHLSYFFI